MEVNLSFKELVEIEFKSQHNSPRLIAAYQAARQARFDRIGGKELEEIPFIPSQWES